MQQEATSSWNIRINNDDIQVKIEIKIRLLWLITLLRKKYIFLAVSPMYLSFDNQKIKQLFLKAIWSQKTIAEKINNEEFDCSRLFNVLETMLSFWQVWQIEQMSYIMPTWKRLKRHSSWWIYPKNAELQLLRVSFIDFSTSKKSNQNLRKWNQKLNESMSFRSNDYTDCSILGNVSWFSLHSSHFYCTTLRMNIMNGRPDPQQLW